MRQHPYHDRHGFILHALCYSLLQEFLSPREVPVARLLDVCKSFPFQHQELSWGHDYGGIKAYIDTENQYPWEDRCFENVEQPEFAQEYADPWNIPELQEILQGAQLPSKDNSRNLDLTGGAVLSNVFTRLPLEILNHIVAFLPTEEVRTLSRTSKELAMTIPSGLGQSFWASRFQPRFELDFIFEAKENRERLDWRAIYFRVAKALPGSLGLQNRKRIWNLIRSPLSELVCMCWSGDLAPHPSDATEDQGRWRKVCGNLQPLVERPGTGKWSVGCKRYRAQRILIPASLRQVAVSTILIGNATYLTGIRFISDEGLEVRLGYKAERDQLSPNTTDQSMDAKSVHGFVLAVGSRGIQALRFITRARQMSQWFGCPDGLPKTRRLATFESMTTLEAGFDVRLAFLHRHQLIDKAC